MPSPNPSLTASLDEQPMLDLWALYDASTRILRAQDPEEVYAAAFEAVRSTASPDRLALLLADEAGTLHCAARRGLTKQYADAVEGQPLWEDKMVPQAAFCVPDIHNAPSEHPHVAPLSAEGVHAAVFVPVAHRDHVLGGLALFYDRPHTCTPAQLRLAGTVAEHVAFAVVHRRTEAARRREHAAAEAERRRLRTVLDTLPVGVLIADAEGAIVEANGAALALWATDADELHVDRMCSNAVFWGADGQPVTPDRWSFARALRHGETATPEELTLRHPDGYDRAVLHYAMPIRSPEDRIEGAVSVTVNVDRLKRAEQALVDKQQVLEKLNATLEQRVEARTQSLLRLTERLQRTGSLLRKGFEVSPFPVFVLTLPELRLFDLNDAAATFLGGPRVPFLGATADALGLDAAPWQAFAGELEAKGEVHDQELKIVTAQGGLRFVNLAATVIDVDGQPCALTMVVDLTNRIRAEERVRALSEAVVLAEKRERERLAAFLHDHLQQLLYGVRLKLGLVHDHTLSDRDRTLLRDADGLLKDALQETRDLTFQLSPPTLRDRGLTAALHELADLLSTRYALSLHVDGRAAVPLDPPQLGALVFQIVRELLFNVVKHARTHEAWVTLDRVGDTLHVTVRDEGRGFDPAQPRDDAPSYGLHSIEERLALLNARLTVKAAPGQGARFDLHIPLRVDGL